MAIDIPIFSFPVNANTVYFANANTLSLDQCEHLLIGNEKQALQSLKSEQKKKEFALSRWLARKILKYDGELLKKPSGAIVWPPGISGSISHKNGIVSFAYTNTPKVIGLDMEITSLVPLSAVQRILDHTEQQILQRSTNESNQSFLPAAIFCGKEAVFKMLQGKKLFHQIKWSGVSTDDSILTYLSTHSGASELQCSIHQEKAFDLDLIWAVCCK